ncbi:ABC transporter permease [Streptomyces sp. NPDC051940]|uniref:ABC transporter permease n=1 Tax=Streptomyces sp. NPDC051940 TaxID=3155675 RepID=UPI003422246A
MTRALHAEWTKLRTMSGPWWLLLGTIAATVALSAGAASVVRCASTGCGGDTTGVGLTGVPLGQAPVAVLAVLVISGEYGSGLIRTTLTAVPRRVTVLAAKAVTLSGLVAVAGTVAVLGSLLAGRLILRGPGTLALFLAEGPTLRAVVWSVLHLLLIALLGLGVATAVRDSATSIGIVLGLLYVVPILSLTISDPYGQRMLAKLAPASPGLLARATGAPVTPWADLGVTAGWAAAALLTGGVLLCRRDV